MPEQRNTIYSVEGLCLTAVAKLNTLSKPDRLQLMQRAGLTATMVHRVTSVIIEGQRIADVAMTEDRGWTTVRKSVEMGMCRIALELDGISIKRRRSRIINTS